MSILVPNSFFILNTLPESCYLCRFKHNGCGLLERYKEEHDGCIPPFHYTDRHLWNPEDKGRVHGCPLKEIPPHGRLIDVHALYKKLFVSEDGKQFPDNDIDNFPHLIRQKDIRRAILYAPTIIEAEEAHDES